MQMQMKVVIVGTGNAAFVLGKKIAESGHQIIQVIGRDIEAAHQLGSAFNCSVAYNTRYINLYADIYLVAVSDNAIEAVASQLKLNNKLVVHCAAAVSKEVLSKSSSRF